MGLKLPYFLAATHMWDLEGESLLPSLLTPSLN